MTKPKAVKVVGAAVEDVLEGARRATENTSSTAATEPGTTTEVKATARRRQFSGSEKRRILVAADLCTAPGEIGALLRREGIYSSHLSTWRQQREGADQAVLRAQKRGPKVNPGLADARRIAELLSENGRLRASLGQAHLIIEVQKKISMLLGISTADPASGSPA